MIDIRNIKSIKIVKSDSPFINIPDEIEELNKEKIKKRKETHPNLKTIYNKW
jgi:hypothetical protein